MRSFPYFRRKARGEELARELEYHVALETERYRAAGMSAPEAEWAARRKLGNIAALKETVHDMNTIRFLESFWQDLRFGMRLLRVNPGFSIVAILSLALGIGANTAIFQLLDSVRLRSLPVSHPEQLAELKIADNDHCCSGNFSNRRSNFTYAQWETIRDRQQVFSSLFASADNRFNLARGGEARFAEGLWVTGDFFRTLGVSAALGNLITSEMDHSGCGIPGAVISYPFWQREFGGDPQVLGKTVSLDLNKVPVIGVTPASFFGIEVGRHFDVALPACSEVSFGGARSHTPRRSDWWLAIIGRLKPGITLTQAGAQANAMSAAIFKATVPPNYRPEQIQWYEAYKLTTLSAGSGVSSLRKPYETPLLILLGIAGLVLLIACANLTNLMLARASAREREMAVRLAIGAGRGRLIRQLLAESLVLTVIGSLMGALLAQVLSAYLVRFLTTGDTPLYLQLEPDWRVLAFTAGLAILTCIFFGLTPALRASRTMPAAAMKTSGRGMTANREGFSLRRLLVVSQIALSLVLLVGALLFVGSLRNLLTLDAGFQEEGLLITAIDVEALHFSPERLQTLYRGILDRLKKTPGVQSVASASIVPVSGDQWNDMIQITGRASNEQTLPWFDRVSSDYFRTMGTPLLSGRDFDDRDTTSAPEVAIVNQEFTRKFFDKQNALGKQFRIVAGPGEPQHAYQIVGIAKNSKYQKLRDDFKPTVFVAQSQDKDARDGINVILRSALPLGPLMFSVKSAIAGVSPEIPLRFQVFKTQIRESLLRERLMATLSGFFGFLAAILATVGLYGVISYMVAKRRNEIGIRIALGADRSQIVSLVVREAGILLVLGLGLGSVLAIMAARTANSLLYGLTAGEPAIFFLAIGILAPVAICASLLPALRAARLDPMAALREE